MWASRSSSACLALSCAFSVASSCSRSRAVEISFGTHGRNPRFERARLPLRRLAVDLHLQ